MSPHKLPITGPKLPLDNKQYLGQLCDAAKSLESLDRDPKYRMDWCLEAGRASYPDDATFHPYWHILWCNTLPTVWIRLAENEELIMMMEYSAFVSKALSFKTTIVTSKPQPSSDGKLYVRITSTAHDSISKRVTKNFVYVPYRK